MLLAREAVPPFKVDSLGISPLDSKFQALMYDVRLQQYLLHMQKPNAAALTVAVVDESAADPPQGKGKGKGKAKGKAKAKVRTRRTVPEELKQFTCRTEDGNVCWDFNMACGCSLKTEKVRGNMEVCARLAHLCKVPQAGPLSGGVQIGEASGVTRGVT